jgi:hypothetical protein
MPLSGQKWEKDRFAPQPALDPFAPLLFELSRFPEFPDTEALGAWVEATREADGPDLMPLRFVEQTPRPRRAKRREVDIARLYDARITCAGEVPCLSQSYHDLFNAMMFKAFPRSKRALHARQYEALRRWVKAGATGLPGQRTREQDALTLFDEGGSVVVCPSDLREEFSRRSLLPLAETGALARLVLFGHALVEHLTEGRIGIRSSARVLFLPEVPQGPGLLHTVDEFVLSLLQDPARFSEPDADAVVFFEGERVAFRRRSDPPPRPPLKLDHDALDHDASAPASTR